ncbi:hypothetical protein shim_12030 [Shimia sp. SK013]|uniref:hypothetical protein n=1 Tax=Shimia sp. SK013 TaxID=1389006 RepID=UPI0006B49121|nr:hypothetical protein [Shimia sp. SK013]KPA22913.1 hypothetical protein shim_12030 [Shimia sp. SK013]
MSDPLDQQLLAAHAANDMPTLIALYCQAAETAPTDEVRGFFLTHAYVFALEIGDTRASDLRQELSQMGRD